MLKPIPSLLLKIYVNKNIFLKENKFLNIEHLVFNHGPKRVGPFSHAVKAGGFLFVTGQMPTLPNDPAKLIDGGILSQTHQVMKNLKTVLTASNLSLENVVFVRIYLVNFKDFEAMNAIYESYFEKNKLPARTCIGVTELAVAASIEIDLIAKI